MIWFPAPAHHVYKQRISERHCWGQKPPTVPVWGQHWFVIRCSSRGLSQHPPIKGRRRRGLKGPVAAGVCPWVVLHGWRRCDWTSPRLKKIFSMLKSLRIMFYPLSPCFRFLPHCLTVGNNVGDNIRVLLFPLSWYLFPDPFEGSRFMQGKRRPCFRKECLPVWGQIYLLRTKQNCLSGVCVCVCVCVRACVRACVVQTQSEIMSRELLDTICLHSISGLIVLTLSYSCLESNSTF